jgi:hypothetical protein
MSCLMASYQAHAFVWAWLLFQLYFSLAFDSHTTASSGFMLNGLVPS